jgi:hypothetical protein
LVTGARVEKPTIILSVRKSHMSKMSTHKGKPHVVDKLHVAKTWGVCLFVCFSIVTYKQNPVVRTNLK